MLNFRNTSIVFAVLLAAMIWYDIANRLPFYYYIILLLVYSLLLFWGSYYVGSNFYFNIICSAKTKQKQIAISFDDGPMPEFTPQVLQILKAHNVPAAFFCIGKRVKEHPELFKKVMEEGHIIGNHSYSHDMWFDLFSASKMYDDLQMMDDAMKEICGMKPILFRPPYGVTNPNLKKAVMKGNYIPVGWNIRSMDTVIKDEKKLLEKVTRLLKPGAVVLFHDTAKVTTGMLSEFIDTVKSNGYEIVRLDKLLNLKPYA
ncbi:MAG: polysaccharide deacetylase family protein [Bacteroidota bacterium]